MGRAIYTVSRRRPRLAIRDEDINKRSNSECDTRIVDQRITAVAFNILLNAATVNRAYL